MAHKGERALATLHLWYLAGHADLCLWSESDPGTDIHIERIRKRVGARLFRSLRSGCTALTHPLAGEQHRLQTPLY